MNYNGLNTSRSKELYKTACELVPGGVGSHAQGYPYFDPYPLFLERGRGSKFWDVDENEFIDYALALGPLIHGHCPPRIVEAIRNQLGKGFVGPPTELLVNVADKITEFVPNADMVRFTNSGTESTMYAIRFARAYTGKDKIIKFEGCYNGGHDYVLINTHPPIKGIGSELRPNKIPDSWGIPPTVLDTVIVLPWNNVEVLEKTIERHAHELAAVITEPVLMNIGCCPPEKGYLEAMRKLTEKNDICLIFDEIITGFRMALGGAQEYFSIKADLATFAKALGAGFPLGAITGTKDIMKWVTPPYIAHYGTYNANPICLAAAEASLAILSENDQAALKRLNELGSMLIEGVRNAVEKTKTQGIVQGIGGLGMQLYFTSLERIMNYRDFTSCDVSKFRRFHKELLKRNIYVHPNQNEHFFISTAHSEDDVVKTISAINEVLRAL